MVLAPAFPAEWLDGKWGRGPVHGVGRQSALASSYLLRRPELDRAMGFLGPAAGSAVAGGGGDPDSDGGTGRANYGVRDPSHGADGDSGMVRHLQKSERGVALLAVLLGVALMTLVVVDFALTSGLGFVSAANQANELRAYYLARSAVSIGLGLLAADERAKQQAAGTGGTQCESLNDAWASPFPPM